MSARWFQHWGRGPWVATRVPALALAVALAALPPATVAQSGGTTAPPASTYDVVGVGADDVLKMRAEPRPDAPTVIGIAPSAKALAATGRTSGDWTEIEFEGRKGWVKSGFLKATAKAAAPPTSPATPTTPKPSGSEPPRAAAATGTAVTIVAQRQHEEAHNAIVSQDGQVIATSSSGRGIAVWEGSSGRRLRTLKFAADDGRLYNILAGITPDGTRLLASLATTYTLWDTMRGTTLVSFQAKDGYSEEIAPAMAGTTLAAVKTDGRSISLLDSAIGGLRRSIAAPAAVQAVALSPDARMLASAHADGSMALWDTANGARLASMQAAPVEQAAIQFAPSGQYLITEHEVTRAWGIDGSLKWQLSTVTTLTPSHDSKLLVATPEGSVQIFDAANGEILTTLVGKGNTLVGFTGGSSAVVLASGDDALSLRTYDARSGNPTGETADPERTLVEARPDLGTYLTSRKDGTLEVTRVEDGRVIQSLGGPRDNSGAFALTRSAARVAWASGNAVEVRSVEDWKPLGRCDGIEGSTSALDFSDDEQRLYVRTEDGLLFICHIAESRLERTPADNAYGALAAVKDRLAFGLEEGGVRLSDPAAVADGGTLSLGEEGSASVIALSADARRVFVGTDNNRIRSWDIGNPRERKTLRMMLGPVTSMALSKDGGKIAAGTLFTPAVKVWNVADGRLLKEMTEADVGSRMWATTAIQFSPASPSILAASFGHTMRLFDTATGTMLTSFSTQDVDLNNLAYTPDGQQLVLLDDAGTLRHWDVKSRKLLLTRRTFADGEWIALTPEGFFDASPNAARRLNAVRGLKAFAIDRVYDALYRPDLVREKLAGDPRGLVAAAAAKLDLDKVLASGLAPIITIVSPAPGHKTSADTIKVEAQLRDQGGGVGRIEWKVNGITQGEIGSRGLGRTGAGSAPPESISQEIALAAGENLVQLTVYNAANLIASEPASVRITRTGQAATTLPTLYVLALGINDYYDSRMRLTYAVPDAKELAAAATQAGANHYARVEVRTLLDSEVTAEGLEKAFDELAARVKPDDVLLFYAAGHGKTYDGRYYFLPRNFRYHTEDSIQTEGLGQDRWQSWFARVRARKSVLIYDTCESGALTGPAGQQVAMRSGLEQQAALGRLIQATGRTVLTAATSDRPALEGYKGHGVFTYALIEAFRRGDRDGNGLIEVTELAGYVDKTVPEITEQAFGLRQLPQMSIQGSDFPLARRLP